MEGINGWNAPRTQVPQTRALNTWVATQYLDPNGGVPKLGVNFCVVIIKRIIVFLGTALGSPYFGKIPNMALVGFVVGASPKSLQGLMEKKVATTIYLESQ